MTATSAKHLNLRAIALALLVAVATACSPAGPSGPTTPAEGSAEREAIFAGMRQGREIQDQVFVVSDLKVQGDWAWVTAAPQSKDGSQHYETESWLLHREGNGWRVAAQPCAEEGCELTSEIAKMRQANPDAPEAIFPK